MKTSKKNILNHHYGSRISTIFMFVAPIFGIAIYMSVVGILPKFPLTESMSTSTGILILGASLVITVLCIIAINSNISKISNVIKNGEEIEAIVTSSIASRRSVTVKYKFTYDGEDKEHSIYLAKKMNTKTQYAVGSAHNIYVFKDEENIIKSTLSLFA